MALGFHVGPASLDSLRLLSGHSFFHNSTRDPEDAEEGSKPSAANTLPADKVLGAADSLPGKGEVRNPGGREGEGQASETPPGADGHAHPRPPLGSLRARGFPPARGGALAAAEAERAAPAGQERAPGTPAPPGGRGARAWAGPGPVAEPQQLGPVEAAGSRRGRRPPAGSGGWAGEARDSSSPPY